MAKTRGDTDTADLFAGGTFYPVRTPAELPRALDMKRGIAVAMGEALRQCAKGAVVVAAEMTAMLGDDEVITPAQLYAYTAESRTSHTISIVRWIAFVRATGCNWLWDYILRDEGLTVLEGEEAHLANAAIMEKQGRALLKMAKDAQSRAPITAKFRNPRGAT